MKDKSVILVVDDQPENTELLEAHLVPQGYEVFKAASGEEALKILSGNQIDLVLLDVMMPRMSGFEVLEKIRADKKIRLIPVVMVTALKATEDRIKALEAGCDDFISKPFDRHEILARVKSLLRIKSLHDEVEAAREFAESVINTVSEPLISLDQDLRVVTVSRSFYDFFKVKPEETVGQLIYDIGNKQWDIPRLRELLENILPEKTSFDNYEVEHDFATIGRRTMLLNARQIEQAIGKERIILLAIEDITARSQLEDLLEESEERYRRIFETATDGIVLLEKREGHIVHANPAAEKMLGYSEAEYIGKMLEDIGIPIDMSDFPAIMESLNKSGILNYEDVPIKSRSGQDVHADVYLVNRAKLAQCNIRDITNRKKAEQVLKESEERYRIIFEGAAEGILVADMETRRFRYCNPAICEMLGYAEEELIGLGATDIHSKESLDHVLAEFEAQARGDRLLVPNLPCLRKDGSVIYADIQTTSTVIDGLACNVGFFTDVTKRRQIEAQLHQAHKMEAIGTLAGGVAHDFNNLLTTIIGNADLSLMAMEKDHPLREEIEDIMKAANSAASLTRQLLAFSRKQIVQPEILDLNKLLTGIEKMLVRLIGEDIEILMIPESALWRVEIDPGQMEQVIMNLVVNAKDAMPVGGKLTIETVNIDLDENYFTDHGIVEKQPGSYVVLTVSDTGIGMDKEVQEYIFDPFYTTKGIGKGTGLGLSTTYGIVKQNNGFIWVYSEPGQGSTFKIYLPKVKRDVKEMEKEQTIVENLSGSEIVLIVEDDTSIRKLAQKSLQPHGYRVLVAENGEDALRISKEHEGTIDLMITDVVMPKMGGKETAERFQALHPQMKVIYMSGYTDNAILHHGVLAPGLNFLEKPFSPEGLARKVREVLDKKQD
jgi:two-component system cell cycle sensor histidine kinase/response regulator CckA